MAKIDKDLKDIGVFKKGATSEERDACYSKWAENQQYDKV